MSVEIIKTIPDVHEYRDWYTCISDSAGLLTYKDIGSIYARVEGVPVILLYIEGSRTIGYLSVFAEYVNAIGSPKEPARTMLIKEVKDILVSRLTTLSSYVIFTESFIEGKYSKEEYIQKVRPLVIK